MDSSLIGTVWSSPQGQCFHIDNISTEDGNTWVYYHNCDLKDKTYNCFIGAFMQRFTQDHQGHCVKNLKLKHGLVL
jgi:hypothetical protein